MKSRRSMLKGAAALAASAAMPAWSQGAPAIAKGSTLTVSTWGVIQDQIKEHVQPEFERATGAKLAYDIGAQGARYNRILAQRNSPPADVFISADDMVIAGVRAGVLQPMPRSAVARTAELHDWAILGKGLVPDGNFAGIAFGVVAHVIGYNPDTVKRKPASWADLWAPEFAGKLAFCAAAHSEMPRFVITAAEMTGGSAQAPDSGFKKLAELRPAKLMFTWTDWAALFKAGEVVIATEFDYYLQTMKRQGYPIEWVVPKERGFASLQSVSIVRNAKSPELAAAFLNTIIEAKIQYAFATEVKQGISNGTVKLTPQQAAQCTCGAQIDQLRFFDPVMIADVRPKWTERITTEVVPHWGRR